MNTRDEALVAEQAWNASKADEDPPFVACQIDHQLKLSTLVTEIENQLDDPEHTVGVQGLEDYEKEVRAVLTTGLKPAPKALLTPAKAAKKGK